MQTAIAEAQSPTIEPTEMSISPVMMISVIGKATIATGATPASAIEMFEVVRKYLETCAPTTKVRDEDDEEEDLPARERRAEAAHCSASASPAPAAPAQPAAASRLALDPLGPPRERAVEEHRREDRGTDHGLQPELVDAEQLHAVLQDGEDHRADRRAVDRAAAAEDADAADDDGRDRLQVAGRGAITASTVPKRAPHSTPTSPHRKPDSMNTKAMPRASLMPSEAGALRIAAERIEVAAGARVARRQPDDDA